MDAAAEDFDVKLQKISADLLHDFDHSLGPFLRKADGRGGHRIRSQVRVQETSRLTNLLDSFQELPQLLDPHLPKWIPLLSDAYLEHLQTRKRRSLPAGEEEDARWVCGVDVAICKLLYTFCKVRSEKVIVRFLNVETRYLEVLLLAIEESEKVAEGSGWVWEQRYVVLLWLSHQMLAPFDLSTISSVEMDDATLPDMPGMRWPDNIPSITARVLPLAIKYLGTPGKERDAARALLVRVSMRRDMQQLGVLRSLVGWSLSALRAKKDVESTTTSYYELGVLSFLAGVLRASADTSDMNTFLGLIFQSVYAVANDQSGSHQHLVSLALARKMLLKVLRSVVVLQLRESRQSMQGQQMTETLIGYLLEGVADNDTPVRLAASKSLSIITLKLDPYMGGQVVEAVLESLNRNVLWDKKGPKPIRDISAVSSLEWHGLMLTLSHLLYRRSPPASQLADIVHALLLGLSFEQRGSSGASVGANVRDAACFGIWSLARRYSSEELKGISTSSVYAAKAHTDSGSIIQVLAIELVVTSTLDPAGNIRRGASAALQELIGRHPDCVINGIALVQAVDYHAVARRSRAIEEVAVNATKLWSGYGRAIMDSLLGWRGVGDADAPSRRTAATGFAKLMVTLAQAEPATSLALYQESMKAILESVSVLQKRQVEERHGLLLCYANVLDQLPILLSLFEKLSNGDNQVKQMVRRHMEVLGKTLIPDWIETTYRKPELVIEAASQVIVSSVSFLQRGMYNQWQLDEQHLCNIRGQDVMSPEGSSKCKELVTERDSCEKVAPSFITAIELLGSVLKLWLPTNDEHAVGSVSAAALVFLIFSSPETREKTLADWVAAMKSKPARATTKGNAYYFTLASAHSLARKVSGSQDIVTRSLLERWSNDSDVDTRIAILQALTASRLLQDEPLTFENLLTEGLNDYSTNARGDVGSLVRVQALKAVKSLWLAKPESSNADGGTQLDLSGTLACSVLRLAAEKLDRVRAEAQTTLALLMLNSHAEQFCRLTFSSQLYFLTILQLLTSESLRPAVVEIGLADKTRWMSELLAGLVTSADTGNEDLVIASRAALAAFCEAHKDNTTLVCQALMQNLRAYPDQDRVSVPTLEVISFLFQVGIFQHGQGINLRNLSLFTQKAGYKTGNVRKVLACVKVYSGIASVGDLAPAGAGEARKRLGALMSHPWPRVRSAVVDEIWGLVLQGSDDSGARLLGVDWAQAENAQVKSLVEALHLL